MNRFNIRKVFVWPAFKFGAVIGAVLMIVPGILWGLLTRESVRALRAFLESLGLLATASPDTAALVERIVNLDKMGPMLVIWTAVATIVLSGLLYGVAAAIAALLYNLIASLSGGLVVGAEMLAVPAPVVPTAPGAQPQAAPAQPQAAPAPSPAAAPAAVQPPVSVPAAQPQPGPWLAIGSPPQRSPVRPDRTRLGSAADNDIVLQGVNPYHAEIRFEDGVYVLYDMAAGQTWVNNRPVAGRNMLKEGFVIRLGGQEMIFRAG